jgi:drug/metabolite transporter (DMT)-like permease
MSTTPLWGAVWAAAAMGETMDWVGWLGGLTVVGSTALVALDHQ